MTYEYQREDGTTFEIQQSMKDDALTVCPETGQKVTRIISGGTGVIWKGQFANYIENSRGEGMKVVKMLGQNNDINIENAKAMNEQHRIDKREKLVKKAELQSQIAKALKAKK